MQQSGINKNAITVLYLNLPGNLHPDHHSKSWGLKEWDYKHLMRMSPGWEDTIGQTQNLLEGLYIPPHLHISGSTENEHLLMSHPSCLTKPMSNLLSNDVWSVHLSGQEEKENLFNQNGCLWFYSKCGHFFSLVPGSGSCMGRMRFHLKG